MSWKKLSQAKVGCFSRGTVFRSPGKYPYENKVDFLLINYPDSASGHALIVATGYKAGHILICLPEEAKLEDSASISSEWLKQNWNKWIYEESKVGDVLYTRDYHIREDGLIGPFFEEKSKTGLSHK